MQLGLLIVIYCLCGIYMLANFKYDIQMLQQNSYRLDRYWRWQKQNLFPAWRIVDIALIFLIFTTLIPFSLAGLIVGLTVIAKTAVIFNRKFKKPLVFTKRVWRIYGVTAALALCVYAVGIIFAPGWAMATSWAVEPGAITIGILLLITIFSYVFVMAAVVILSPVEKIINRKYVDDAARILSQMPDLKVIGVTGSYGKTSTKHYLQRILSEQFDVLMTPGSYNTTMGVVRTIREMMKPYNQIFICEMGAKQRGDVKEICDLVHPEIGIVTAVGPMHLESFGSIDNVCDTKFELVDSLPADGLAVINNDFAPSAARKVDNVRTLRYAVSTPGGDYRAEEITYTPQGTSFVVVDKEGTVRLPLTTKLVGEFNISNLLGAVAVALQLGMDHDRIAYAVRCIEQVEHRLNVKTTPGGVTIIDDAFNSNPTGSRMAVDVLSQFKGGRRIIVTPGMIELGDEQFELNKRLGRHIGLNVDIAVIVGRYNRDALIEGIKTTDFLESNLVVVDSFAEAQNYLQSVLAKGDTVLYENDLPDTFK